MCGTCLFAGTTLLPESVDFLKGLGPTISADSARLLSSLRRREGDRVDKCLVLSSQTPMGLCRSELY